MAVMPVCTAGNGLLILKIAWAICRLRINSNGKQVYTLYQYILFRKIFFSRKL
jgi:hypothetical protein